MKNVGFWGAIIVAVALVGAIILAGQMGKTSKAHVTGSVRLDPELTDAAKGIRTLYITIFDMDRPFPPYASFRKTLASDPEGEFYDFLLTEERMTVMQQGMPFPKNVRLKARLDRDGSAGPDRPGDLTGEVTGISKGSKGIEIRINKRIDG